MTKIVIKKADKDPILTNFDGEFEDLNRVIDTTCIQFTPFELGDTDLSIGFNPLLYQKEGSIPNFFVYDKYSIVFGDAIIIKMKYDKKVKDYVLIDVTKSDFKMIQEYMRRESWYV